MRKHEDAIRRYTVRLSVIGRNGGICVLEADVIAGNDQAAKNEALDSPLPIVETTPRNMQGEILGITDHGTVTHPVFLGWTGTGPLAFINTPL